MHCIAIVLIASLSIAPAALADETAQVVVAVRDLVATPAPAVATITGVCPADAGDRDAHCLVIAPNFPDTDRDGEHDETDRCPSTAPAAAVDAAGCSQEQFCGSVSIHHWRDARLCRFVDWQNDETFRRPEDCRLADTDSGFLCVAH